MVRHVAPHLHGHMTDETPHVVPGLVRPVARRTRVPFLQLRLKGVIFANFALNSVIYDKNSNWNTLTLVSPERNLVGVGLT